MFSYWDCVVTISLALKCNFVNLEARDRQTEIETDGQTDKCCKFLHKNLI